MICRCLHQVPQQAVCTYLTLVIDFVEKLLGTVQVSVVATRLPLVAATATAAARERNATDLIEAGGCRKLPSHKASFLIMQAKSSRSSTLSGPSESCDAYRTGWEKKRVGTTSGIEAFTLLGIVTSLAHPIRAPILGNLLIPVNIKWVPSERKKKGSTFFPRRTRSRDWSRLAKHFAPLRDGGLPAVEALIPAASLRSLSM